MIRTALALILLLAAPASAAPRDGAWWGEAPESFKLGYVAGYLAGRDEQAAKWSRLTDDAVAQLPEDARAPFAPVLEALRAESKGFDDATYGNVAEQVDRFYRPEKNRAIPLAQALTIVRQALEGVDQQYLYCQTEYFRLAHDQRIPMKDRMEALGKKAAECVEMSPEPPEDEGPEPPGGMPQEHAPPQ